MKISTSKTRKFDGIVDNAITDLTNAKASLREDSDRTARAKNYHSGVCVMECVLLKLRTLERSLSTEREYYQSKIEEPFTGDE
jgi:hypothetical protein